MEYEIKKSQYFPSVLNMGWPVVRVLCMLTHLIPITTIGGGVYYFYTRVTDEKSEAQKS